MAIKLIGADLSGSTPAAKLPQATPVNQLTPTTGFQFAGQQLAQAGQSMQSSIQSQARMTSAMAQDNAQTTEAFRVSQQTQLQAANVRGENNLKGLVDVGNMIVKTLDDVEKRKAARRKAEQDANAAMIDEQLTKWELTSIEKARTDPGGIVGLTRDLEGLFGPDADITQDDRAKLMKRGYGHLAGIQTKNVEDRVNLAGKVRDNMDAATVSQVGIMNANFVSAITNSSSEDERTGIINKLMASNKELLGGRLSPNATALVKRDLYENIRKASEKATDKNSSEYKQLANMQAYASEILDANERLKDNPLELKRYKGMLEKKYGIEGEFGQYYDPNAGQKLANEQGTLDASLQGLQANINTREANNAPNSSLELGALVNVLPTIGALDGFLTNPANTKYVVGGKETNHGRMLRQAYSEIRGTTKEETAATQKLADINIQKSKLGTESVSANIAYLSKLRPENASSQDGAASIRAQLSSLPGIDSTKAAGILSALGSMPSGTDPAAFNAWASQMGDQYQALQKSLQDEAVALDGSASVSMGEINRLKVIRAQYGFIDDGNGKTTFDTKSYDIYLAKRKAEAEARKPVPGVAGTPANFSRPALATVKSPTSGKQVYVPFKKGTSFSIGDGYLARGGAHKGVDLPANQGTPIIAPLRGKVTINSYQEGRAGNYIAVAYEDGTEHAYFHLPTRSPLAVGQPVVAGQVIGAVGSTGRSSGPHLHWEVFGKSGARMDPYVWAEEYSNTPQPGGGGGPRQPRSVETSYKTRQHPPGTTPIFGGYIQGTGAKATVVMYDKPNDVKPVGYTSATPLRGTSDSRRVSQGGLDADHGYKALQADPPFRRALNETSQRLGFNGQWLADAMAGESGFSPSIKQRGGHPAVGMIQFYEDPGTPGYKTINGKRYSLQQIGAMSRLEQLKVVENYFIEAQRNAGGRAKSPEDVLGLIWANKLDKDIPLNYSDNDITWGKYRKTLGRQVGRKYSSAPSRDANTQIATTQSSDRSSRVTQQIHEIAKTGCIQCANMVALGRFVPHDKSNSLNRGGELFTYG